MVAGGAVGGEVVGLVEGALVGLLLGKVVGKKLKSYCESMEGLKVRTSAELKAVPPRHLGAIRSRQKSIPTLVDVLVVSVASWVSTSCRVYVAGLLVLAGSTVVVSSHAITVGRTEPARDPLAFDGCFELCNRFGVA